MARDDDFADRGNSPVDGWPPDFDHLVIPDDASELDAEARALAREQRAAARTERLRAVLRVRRWHQYPLSWPIAVAVVALVATVVSMLVLLRPAGREAPRARPLGTAGLRPVGGEGGLVPDVEVRRDGGTPAPVRAFRPAVLVLTPAGCDCAGMLRTVLRVADKHHVYAVVIGPDLPVLPADLLHSALIRAADAGHLLLPAYHVGDKPVLLLVRDNGIVNRILSDAPPDTVLDPEVVVLTA
jgi:hypothetical protein